MSKCGPHIHSGAIVASIARRVEKDRRRGASDSSVHSQNPGRRGGHVTRPINDTRAACPGVEGFRRIVQIELRERFFARFVGSSRFLHAGANGASVTSIVPPRIPRPLALRVCEDQRLLTFPDRAGDRVRFHMADAQVPSRDFQLVGNSSAFTGQNDGGLAAGLADDFDVRPRDSAAPSGPQNF